ncbi:MAG: hypothetical protein ACFFCL_13665, partial [Promethearchaeota archaeon]
MISLSRSKPQELVRVKQLIDLVKFDEADKLIKEFEEKRGRSLHDIILCRLFKCDLLFYQGYYEDVIKITEQAYKASLGLGKNLLSVDLLLRMVAALIASGQREKAQEIIKQGEEMLKTLTRELPSEYKQREAYIAQLKGFIFEQKLDYSQAIKQYELNISLREELGDKMEIVWPIIGIARILMNRGDFGKASKCLKRSLLFAKESGNKRCIGGCLLNLGYLHFLKGEFDNSMMFYKQSLT